MDYNNEQFDTLLPADGSNAANIFPTVTFVGNVSINASEVEGAMESALALVKDNLTEFLTSPTFAADMQIVFGESTDVELGATIVDALRVGGGLSEIIVVSADLMNGAVGGFDSLTGAVYLTDGLINESPLRVADVLVEEFGHLIDSELNLADTPGDEGEFFAALVSGDDLSEADVERLRGEDDTVEILNGLVEVEANEEVSFSKATDFDFGFGTTTEVGDFNGDGISDLVVEDGFFEGDASLSVLLGNGDGSFSKATEFDVREPESIAVGDFNGDGISDLAVANYSDQNDLSVLLGNGDGTFGKATNLNAGSYSFSLAVGEFNGDGISDLAVTNFYDTVSVLLGNGNGSFSEATEFDVDRPESIAVGEFNGDGISDLVVGNWLFDTVSVLLGNGDGSFSEATDFNSGDNPQFLALGDFNGDGISDLAVTDQSTNNNVFVLLGNGNGGFGKPTKFDVKYAEFIAVADFNGDSISDLAVTSFSTNNSLSVLLGNGDGSFNKATKFKAGDSPDSLAVGDFNGDDLPDLAMPISTLDNNLSILLNTTPIPPKINISNTRITEGNEGRKNAKFTVTFDRESDETVTVNYATANDTAKAGKDYRKTSGTLTFKPGQTKKTITVPILGDTQDESNEKFQVNLSKPKNGELEDNRGIATIRDNDKPPTVSIADKTITEGNKGRKNAQFTVTLDEASGQTVKVNYATGNGSAKAGKDYRKTTGTLTFKPGQTEKTITVPILGDTRDESNEKFTVNLSKPKKAKLGDKRGIGTIRDND